MSLWTLAMYCTLHDCTFRAIVVDLTGSISLALIRFWIIKSGSFPYARCTYLHADTDAGLFIRPAMQKSRNYCRQLSGNWVRTIILWFLFSKNKLTCCASRLEHVCSSIRIECISNAVNSVHLSFSWSPDSEWQPHVSWLAINRSWSKWKKKAFSLFASFRATFSSMFANATAKM